MTSPIDTIKGFSGKYLKIVDANFDNSKMNQEDFLKVLLATFKYQDPFEAQDISKFIDNTVKLRELEVMNNFENAVNKISSSDEMLLKAANLIGEKVEYLGNKTYFENGKSQIEFEVKEPADIVNVYLYDKNGNVIDQQEFKDIKPGSKKKIEFVENIDDGYYNISIIAKNSGEDVKTSIYSTAKISGVEKYDNTIKLLYAQGSLELNDIVKIGG
ncbi:flagellar hook assembly protein FlgD [Nitrosophilus kaiyonis]|uniref:flagellar hook assembly protein FlgD n=1 Tax=Nitrosophilus kaiyonis TaxID=2930200 RepID=UPI002492095E|nr:flagellar hook capping FlgD N-terminal domain-containing protein [Nitrosophilus kaiyonis]